MADLSVEVRHHDIIVSHPETGRCVIYRRDANSLMLEAFCEMRNDPDSETLQFFTQASTSGKRSNDTGLSKNPIVESVLTKGKRCTPARRPCGVPWR